MPGPQEGGKGRNGVKGRNGGKGWKDRRADGTWNRGREGRLKLFQSSPPLLSSPPSLPALPAPPALLLLHSGGRRENCIDVGPDIRSVKRGATIRAR